MTSLFSAQPVISADRAQIYVQLTLGHLAPRYNNTLAIAADSGPSYSWRKTGRVGHTVHCDKCIYIDNVRNCVYLNTPDRNVVRTEGDVRKPTEKDQVNTQVSA